MGPKRASVGDPESSSSSRKRARVAGPSHAKAKALVDDIINAGDSENYTFPEDSDELFAQVLGVAQYVRHLEDQLKSASNAVAEATEASKKSPEEIAEAAEKVRKAAVAGIKKQMSVCRLVVLFWVLTRSNCICLYNSGSLHANRTELNGATMASAQTRKSLGSCSSRAVLPNGRQRNSRRTNSRTVWAVLKHLQGMLKGCHAPLYSRFTFSVVQV